MHNQRKIRAALVDLGKVSRETRGQGGGTADGLSGQPMGLTTD